MGSNCKRGNYCLWTNSHVSLCSKQSVGRQGRQLVGHRKEDSWNDKHTKTTQIEGLYTERGGKLQKVELDCPCHFH